MEALDPIAEISRVDMGPDALCQYTDECTESATHYVEATHTCGFKKADPMCAKHADEAVVVPRLYGSVTVPCPGCGKTIAIRELNTHIREI